MEKKGPAGSLGKGKGGRQLGVPTRVITVVDGGERGRRRQEGLQGEGQVGGQWRGLDKVEELQREAFERVHLRTGGRGGGGLHRGFGCGPMGEMGALSVSFPTSRDSAPLSISVAPRRCS